MRRALAVTATAGALFLPLGAVGCASGPETEDVTVYEDCDTDDQFGREADCGYTDSAGNWVWFTWVILGQRSFAPHGWVPPLGVNPPKRVVTVPRGKPRPCALGAVTDVTVVSVVNMRPPPPPPPPRIAPPPPPPRVNPNPPVAPGKPGAPAQQPANRQPARVGC